MLFSIRPEGTRFFVLAQGGAMQAQARAFVDLLTTRIHPVITEYSESYWKLATRGTPEDRAAVERLGAAYTHLFIDDPSEWETIRRLFADRAALGDEELRRSVERLYRMYAAEQIA